MLELEGRRCPEKREGRARLSVRDPQIEMLLRGLLIEDHSIDEVRRWGKAAWADRNCWDIRRRSSGGLFSARLLRRDEAERTLRIELAAMAEGGAE